MKKLILMILSFVLALSLCACTKATGQSADTVEKSAVDEIASPDAGRSHEDIMTEVRSCIFPVDGEKDIETAMDLLLPLVEEGDAEAQYYWGWIYDYDLEENDETEKESLHWYKLAMEQGYLKAYLGVSFNQFVESEEKAEEIAREAIQGGLLDLSDVELGQDGLHWLGNMYYYGYGVEQDYAQAYGWFLKAAEAGNNVDMSNLGFLYYSGYGIEQDYEKAFKWYLKAAKAGNNVAMNYLGWMYENGYGVEKDYEKAYDWFLKAAEAGNNSAMNNLGFLYYNGYGVEQNYAKAYEWYLSAARAGDPAIMNWIGDEIYNHRLSLGTGYEKGYTNAMGWYIDAYLNGNEKAVDSINAMLEKGEGLDVYYERYNELLLAQLS